MTIDVADRPGLRGRLTSALLTAPRWPAWSARSVALALACIAVGASPVLFPGGEGFEPVHAVLLVMLAVVGVRMPLPIGLGTAFAAEAVLAAERIAYSADEGSNGDAVMAIVWMALGPLVVAASYELSEAPRRRVRASADAALNSVLQALAVKDGAVDDHSGDVAELAVAVGRRLGVRGPELAELHVAGALHDLGKLAVPQQILDKPGPLSAEEWEIIRRHPAAGEDLVLGIPALAHLAPLLRAMHEHWDGGGYPDGLRGEQIPLPSRIVAVCDAYQAIVSDRPYDPPRSPEAAVEELREGAGSQFDPRVVPAFLQVLRERGTAAGPSAAAAMASRPRPASS
ncbi:MAG TPA: HD-GYP domain-containing protein [Miltoncostaeaceae bacterium]|nr:HD-GYP domain-containing protein [Miltoncostaeaceae bacterium]